MSNIKNTLTELIIKNFIEAKEKRVHSKKTQNKDRLAYNPKFSISTILIDSALKEIKGKSKEDISDEGLEEDTEGKTIEDERKVIVNGGYGTIKPYAGMSPHIKYTDYDKIWGHLGSFRTYNMYDSTERTEIAMRNGESSREMVSSDTQMRAARSFKYFIKTATMEAHADYLTISSLVPPVGSGINSNEWEKYVLMMKMSVYQPLLRLNARMA